MNYCITLVEYTGFPIHSCAGAMHIFTDCEILPFQAGILLSASDTDLVSKVDMPCISKEIGVIVQVGYCTWSFHSSIQAKLTANLSRPYRHIVKKNQRPYHRKPEVFFALVFESRTWRVSFRCVLLEKRILKSSDVMVVASWPICIHFKDYGGIM